MKKKLVNSNCESFILLAFLYIFVCLKKKQANFFFVDFFLINFFLFKKTHSLIPTTH